MRWLLLLASPEPCLGCLRLPLTACTAAMHSRLGSCAFSRPTPCRDGSQGGAGGSTGRARSSSVGRDEHGALLPLMCPPLAALRDAGCATTFRHMQPQRLTVLLSRARAPQPGPLIPAMLPGKFTAGPRPRGTRRRGEGGGGIFKQAAVEVLRLEKRLMSTGGSVCEGPRAAGLQPALWCAPCSFRTATLRPLCGAADSLVWPRRRDCARGPEAWPDQVHRKDSRGNHGLRAVSAVAAWVLVAAGLAHAAAALLVPACKWCMLPSASR